MLVVVVLIVGGGVRTGPQTQIQKLAGYTRGFVSYVAEGRENGRIVSRSGNLEFTIPIFPMEDHCKQGSLLSL